MCNNPSRPPKSINAPKSVIFFTIPCLTCPTSNSLTSDSLLFSLLSSSIARRETTIFLRRLFSLIILKLRDCPISSSILGTLLRAICEPGRKASTPMTSTVTPPFIFLVKIPSTGSSFSCASLMISHTLRKSAFFFDNITTPSSSSRLSNKTSIVSPV